MKQPTPAPDVEVEEVLDVTLRALVTAFEGRRLTWPVAEKGLALASFQIKQTALEEIARQTKK